MSGEILVGFGPPLDRSRLASSGALNDDALDESIGHQEHSADEDPGPVLHAAEALSKLGDDIQRTLERNLGDEHRSSLSRLDLEC